MVGGLTQSGPMAEKIWEDAIKEIWAGGDEFFHSTLSGCEPETSALARRQSLPRDIAIRSGAVKNYHAPSQGNKILLLGVGGGSLVKLLNKYFPDAKVIGVEIDSLMINLGKKYLELEKAKNFEIIIDDAENYVQSSINYKQNFDLIFVDMYKGDKVPENLENINFLQNLKNILSINGLVIFNRLYYKNHIFEANIFLDKLKKIFNDLRCKKIYTNIFLYCKK
ncbi:MAG: methyltransferase domain-containing protein [Candidatus Gottesmanbacteria bacterium]